MVLVGCSPTVSNHGHRVDAETLTRIVPGQTSRDQVLQLLGSPSSTATFGDSAWYYVSQRTERLSFYQEEIVQQDVLAITFDEHGIVSGMERHGLDQAREIDLVARETPTAGNELSVLEQFIGNLGRFNVPEDDRLRRER